MTKNWTNRIGGACFLLSVGFHGVSYYLGEPVTEWHRLFLALCTGYLGLIFLRGDLDPKED